MTVCVVELEIVDDEIKIRDLLVLVEVLLTAFEVIRAENIIHGVKIVNFLSR